MLKHKVSVSVGRQFVAESSLCVTLEGFIFKDRYDDLRVSVGTVEMPIKELLLNDFPARIDGRNIHDWRAEFPDGEMVSGSRAIMEKADTWIRGFAYVDGDHPLAQEIHDFYHQKRVSGE